MIKTGNKTATSVSCASKTPLVKDQVKPVKAEKPIKEKKWERKPGVVGVDRVAPAKTALAF